MRSDPGVVRNYGKLLVEMVSIVPDGVVCFFVSYSYMDGIIATWNETGILKVRCRSSYSVVYIFFYAGMILHLAVKNFVAQCGLWLARNRTINGFSDMQLLQ